jgi:hypothetical protein
MCFVLALGILGRFNSFLRIFFVNLGKICTFYLFVGKKFRVFRKFLRFFFVFFKKFVRFQKIFSFFPKFLALNQKPKKNLPFSRAAPTQTSSRISNKHKQMRYQAPNSQN